MIHCSVLTSVTPLLRITALLLLPGSVLAQALSLLSPESLPQDSEQQYLAFIEQEEDTRGLTSPDLIEPLTTLAQQYVERRDYDRAFEAFAQARQIMRVNNGFDTLAELPLLEQLARVDEARGNFEQAWEYEQALLSLAGKHTGKLETVPYFREAAERRLAMRRNYIAGERPPQIVLGCYYAQKAQIDALVRRGVEYNRAESVRRNCTAGERDTVNVALLLEAREYQMQALEALFQNGRYASDELWEALTEVLRTSDLVQRRLPLFNDPALGRMMTRLLSVEVTDTASALRRAQILIQLADMNVVRTGQADRYVGYDAVLEQYEQAYTAMRNEGLAQTELDAIFSPPVPVLLPAFYTNPLATEAQGTDYIDVSFEITRQGKTRRIEVVGESGNIERGERRELLQRIDQGSFRPRLVDGRVAELAPVTLRYYLAGDR